MKLPEIHIEAFFEKDRRAHLFFCLALLVLMVFILSVSQKWKYAPGAILIYSFILGGIYTGRWLCRKWLMNSKWGGLIAMLAVVLLGYCVLGLGAYIYFFVPDLPLNHMIESAINITACSFALIFIGFFIAVIRSAIREKMNGLVLAEQKKGSELNLLRSQVSPHFLFNTLNNMYSLSINRPGQMPDLLLKLSDLLRYSVYEADQPLVQLNEELEYIRNYIALENIRSADRLLLTINLTDTSENVKIAPMLLVVFIENAFKHALNTLENEIQIVINCQVISKIIYFDVANSYTENEKKGTKDQRSSGFGIANVIKRLDLLYPGEYELNQTRTANQFKVELCLKAR